MSLINNALSGALAAQIALDTTSQNIANVATAGYSRQSALLAAIGATRSGNSAGSGVSVPSLIRFSDGYTNLQMWRAASQLGQANVAQPYLTQAEQVFGDDTSNLSSGLNGFFSALNAASVDPASSPLRQQVLAAADSLAQRVNSLAQVLDGQSSAIHEQRASTVDQVNEYATEIASLNQKIVAAQAVGANAASLMDARDQKIDGLAGLVAIQITNQPDGSRNISLRAGPPLVAGAIPSTLAVVGHADGSQSLTLSFANQSFAVGGSDVGGQLGGLDHYESQVLDPLKQSIADVAQQLGTAVNNQLAAGYGTTGAAGVPLFSFDPSSATSMLTVNSSVLPADLGFSSDPAKPGNSDNLLALINLKSQPFTIGSLGSVQLGDASTQMIGKLGTASQQNQSAIATAQTVRDQSIATWKSVSGVNSDEEAVNLVTYQQMYQANMKVAAVAGTLFEATLSMMG